MPIRHLATPSRFQVVNENCSAFLLSEPTSPVQPLLVLCLWHGLETTCLDRELSLAMSSVKHTAPAPAGTAAICPAVLRLLFLTPSYCISVSKPHTPAVPAAPS